MEIFDSSGEAGIVVINVDGNETVDIKFHNTISVSVIFSKDEANFNKLLYSLERKTACAKAKLGCKENSTLLEGGKKNETDKFTNTSLQGDSTASSVNRNENECKSQYKGKRENVASAVTKCETSNDLYDSEHDDNFDMNSEDDNDSGKYDVDREETISMNDEDEEIQNIGNVKNDLSQSKRKTNCDLIIRTRKSSEGSNCDVKCVPLESFPCDVCQNVFCTNQDLADHQSAITEKVNCSICKEVCKSRAHLLLHNHSLHSSSEDKGRKVCIECPQCYQTFLQYTDLIEHIKCWHTNEGMYQCCVCCRVFRSCTTFTLHLDNFRVNKVCSDSKGKGSKSGNQVESAAPVQNTNREAVHGISKRKIQWVMQRKPLSVPDKSGQVDVDSVPEISKSGRVDVDSVPEISKSGRVDVDSIKSGVMVRRMKINDKNNFLALHKVWECLFCERKFKGGYEFTIHKKPMMAVLVCKKCGARAKSKAEYLLHQYERHSEDEGGDISIHDRSHRCPVCREDLVNIDALTHIMQKHTGELPYKCCVCGISLDSNESWVSHGKTHLDPSCDESNASRSILVRHLCVVNAQVSNEKICKLCKGSFQSERDFVHHHKKEIKLEECNICKIITFTEAGSIVHRYISHGLCPGEENPLPEPLDSTDSIRKIWEEDVPFDNKESESIKCPCCLDSVPMNEVLFHVMKRHTLETPFECCSCKKHALSTDEYFDHCDFHLGKKIYDSKSPLCLQCNLRFESRRALKAHQNMHNTVCPYCQMEFSSNIFLDIHLQNVHASEMEACSFCGKLFSSSDKLATHERHHFYLKEEQCPLCGKTFSNKCMKRHMIRAHGDKTADVDLHLCSICGKKFSEKRNMETHKLSHQRGEQFECEVCGKKFRSNLHLKNHAKIHLQERRLFVCHICGKSCTESYNLKVHMRIHSNVKVFQCSFCDQGFNYNQSLQSHIRKKHKIQALTS